LAGERLRQWLLRVLGVKKARHRPSHLEDRTYRLPTTAAFKSFQRGFVWKPTQVRDLAESLWCNYPIGSSLVWNSHGPPSSRIPIVTASRPTNQPLRLIDAREVMTRGERRT
jgi:hypothetical protein